MRAAPTDFCPAQLQIIWTGHANASRVFNGWIPSDIAPLNGNCLGLLKFHFHNGIELFAVGYPVFVGYST